MPVPSIVIPQTIFTDPLRPGFHFCAPYGWMNDPNGVIHYQGEYHVFFQWNPYGDEWGHIHWGHARSRDLLHWEYLEPALIPDAEQGEDHCFSGCLVADPDRDPMIFYTAVGPKMSARDGAQQWAAFGDRDLIRWQKSKGNPFLPDQVHEGLIIKEWRDPFFFRHEGKGFLLLGGIIPGVEKNLGVILLYESLDNSLLSWKYRGILFSREEAGWNSLECPNLFCDKDRWVLIFSTKKNTEYLIGDFDPQAGAFMPVHSGLLDGSDHFYATSLTRDDTGRQLCFGWIRGFPAGRGWSGCHSIVRELSISNEGKLLQKPVEEIKRLRAEDLFFNTSGLIKIPSVGFELELEFDLATVVSPGLAFSPETGSDSVEIRFTPDKIMLGTKSMNWNPIHGMVQVTVFVDRSVIEVFVNSQYALTLVRDELLGPCTVKASEGLILRGWIIKAD